MKLFKFKNKGGSKPPAAPLSAAEERERRRKAGMCEQCGKVKTHGSFLTTRQPLTVRDQVYKGFCLTCHSITEIQCILAEPLGRPSIDRPEQRPRPADPLRAEPGRQDYDLPVRHGASGGSGAAPGSSNGNAGGNHGHGPLGSRDAGRAAGGHSPSGGPFGGGNGDDHGGDGRNNGRSGNRRRDGRRSVEGRPHDETKNAAEGGGNGGGHWEDYFNTEHQQNESRRRRGVPGFIESQDEDDSATVVSELTLDPVFAAQNHADPMREESLPRITEEGQAGDGDGDEGNDAGGCSWDHKGDHDRDHSSSSSGTSYKQSAGGSAGNNQTRAGSATSGDSRFESLLKNKIEAEDAERRGSRAASSVDQHGGDTKQTMTNGGTSNQARPGSVALGDSNFEKLLKSKMEAEGMERRGSSGSQRNGEKKQSPSSSTANVQARAGSVSCGDSNFEKLLKNKLEAEQAERRGSGAVAGEDRSEGKNLTYRGGVLGGDAGRARPGAQAVRKGSILDSMMNKKEANEVARSRSLCAPPPSPRDGDGARSHSLPLGGGNRAVAQLMGQLRAEAEGNVAGAHRADASDDADQYVSVYKRKMAEEGRQHRGEEDALGISESEARSQVSDCSRCDELVGFLEANRASRRAVTVALPKLRDCLLGEHGGLMSDDSRGEGSARSETAFPDGAWARVMTTVMSSHPSNALVQAEVLRTVWCIVALDPQYAADAASGDGMSQVATAMETHANDGAVQEYGCGLLAGVAAVEGHARGLLGREGKYVRGLMAALNFGKGRESVTRNALRALLSMSSAFPSTESSLETFAHMMGRHANGYPRARDCADNAIQCFLPRFRDRYTVNAIRSVLDAMGCHLADSSVQTLGNRLLWNIFSPDEKDLDIHKYARETTKHVMSALVACRDSLAFQETAICLLYKISCYRNEVIDKETFMPAILNSMSTHPNSSIIALYGCRCIAEVQAMSLAQSPTNLMADAVPTIIACMEINQESVCIQSEACAALVIMCANSPENKQRTCEAGGVTSIMHAYGVCGADEGLCFVAKTRACAALATLALDPMGLSAIRNEGIITKFERLLEQEEDMPIELGSSIRRFLALASDEERRRHNLTFCDGAGEDEVSDCLCSNLRLRATPDISLGKIACLRTNAIRAMKAFPMSADINEYACKLLACTFAMASKHNITGRDGVDLEELEAVMSSIVQHKCNAEVVAAACSTLRNFSIMRTPFDNGNPTGLNGLLSKACDEIAKGLVIHQRNERYLEQATGALQALCAMRGGLALSFESGSIIGLLVGALDRYPSAKNLQRHIIGIVGSFFAISDQIKDSISCDLVAAIMRFIDAEIANDDGEVSTDCVDIAVNIILVISNQGFNEVQVLLNENVADTIGSVINCMWKWPHDPSIQSACIDILSNLSVNNSLWDEVCQRGGVSCMLSALSNLNHDPVLVCKAFEAFTNLMLSGTDVMGILDAHEPPVPAILVSAMTAHEDELPIQARGAHVIWATSSKTNSLKEDFVTLGGAEAVAGAMMRFTASRQMQLRGFYAIWSLAVPRHLKTRVGRCAIGPVVNGLSAHFLSENRSESTEVCERALGCVKCLSTSSRNKDLLRESGAIDVIYSCVWMHLKDVAICGAALAAICNICVDVDTNQVVEITQEDLDAVVAALRIHRHTKLIQETAIVLLKNFTFSRSNIAILERNPFLIGLVCSAMSNIDDNHRESANHLLRVLPLACWSFFIHFILGVTCCDGQQ